MAGEMVAFDDGLFGMALNLDEESIGVVLLGDGQRVKQDDRVRRTGRVMSVPVGKALLGRVVNARDSRSTEGADRDVYARADRAHGPGIADRQRVCESLHTGVKVAVAGCSPFTVPDGPCHPIATHSTKGQRTAAINGARHPA